MKTGYELARLLAYVTGLVNRELLLQIEYLAAENRILRGHAPARLRLSDAERATLGEIGKRLGRKGLANVAQVARPETILCWWRKRVAQRFDGSKHRSYPGRPKIDPEIGEVRKKSVRLPFQQLEVVSADEIRSAHVVRGRPHQGLVTRDYDRRVVLADLGFSHCASGPAPH